MDVLIFVALPKYFIRKAIEREVDCDTSIHHSIEEEKSFDLRYSCNIKTWIIDTKGAVYRKHR